MEIKDDKILDRVTGGNVKFITVTMRQGENLGSIASQYGVTVQQILSWNGNLNKSNINLIQPGTQIRILISC